MLFNIEYQLPLTFAGHCRQRLYEAACDALEEALHSPLPNRIVPPAAA